jgi:hypothetical protein
VGVMDERMWKWGGLVLAVVVILLLFLAMQLG